MEDNLVSKLSRIKESTDTSFKTDYDSMVNIDSEITLIYINSLLTKRIDVLSEDEKSYLNTVENILGVEDYKKLKNLLWSFMVANIQNVNVMDNRKLDYEFDRVKKVLEGKVGVLNRQLRSNTANLAMNYRRTTTKKEECYIEPLEGERKLDAVDAGYLYGTICKN